MKRATMLLLATVLVLATIAMPATATHATDAGSGGETVAAVDAGSWGGSVGSASCDWDEADDLQECVPYP